MASYNLSEKNYFSIIWSINNFSYCWQKTGEYLSSPSFLVDSTEESKWKLVLFPCGCNSRDYITLRLYTEKDSFHITDVDYMIQFLASDGTTLDISKDKFTHHASTERQAITKEKYFPRDVLKLRCRILLKKETSEIKTIFFRTLINIDTISSIINIEKFSNLVSGKPGYVLVKSEFEDIIMEINITVVNNPAGDIFLDISTFDKNMKYFTLKIFITNCNNLKVNAGEYKYCLHNGECKKIPFLFCNRYLNNNKNLYSPNDVLTLLLEFETTGIPFNGIDNTICDFSSQSVSIDSTEMGRICKLSDCPSALITDLASLKNDQNSCDMKIQTKTNIYHVHTLILGARSPVFKAMFSSEMKETVNGRVDVSDLEDETVRLFLLYLYTDQLGDLKWEDALSLYSAADKYAVFSLRDKCSTFLMDSLQLENVCKVLTLSELHQDKNLKISAQNYVLKNAKEILKSEDWKILVDTNSKLAVETMSRNWMED